MAGALWRTFVSSWPGWHGTRAGAVLGCWCTPVWAAPHSTSLSPLSAGSHSDAYRKASAAGCSPCESSPAATPLGEPGTRASGDETPATPKGGRRAGTACPCPGLPGHVPMVPPSTSPCCSPLDASASPAAVPMLQPCQPCLRRSVHPCCPVSVLWCITRRLCYVPPVHPHPICCSCWFIPAVSAAQPP